MVLKDADFSSILGKDPFGASLDNTVAGEAVDGRQVVAGRLIAAADARSCGILFIGSSESARLPQILAALSGANVLTVSDMPRFAAQGGMIQFLLEGDRVRFSVNLGTARQARLTLSSELLKVAVRVMQPSAGEAGK